MSRHSSNITHHPDHHPPSLITEGTTSQEEGYDKTFTFLKTQYIRVKLIKKDYAELMAKAQASFIAAMSNADFQNAADYLGESPSPTATTAPPTPPPTATTASAATTATAIAATPLRPLLCRGRAEEATSAVGVCRRRDDGISGGDCGRAT